MILTLFQHNEKERMKIIFFLIEGVNHEQIKLMPESADAILDSFIEKLEFYNPNETSIHFYGDEELLKKINTFFQDIEKIKNVKVL